MARCLWHCHILWDIFWKYIDFRGKKIISVNNLIIATRSIGLVHNSTV